MRAQLQTETGPEQGVLEPPLVWTRGRREKQGVLEPPLMPWTRCAQ
jgi:hypothetical protein